MTDGDSYLIPTFILTLILDATSASWTLRAGVSAPQRVPSARPGGDEAGHVSQVEVGLLAVGERTRSQQLSLPLSVRAPG